MPPADRRDDRLGFDESRNPLTETLGRLVPQSVARRALAVDNRG